MNLLYLISSSGFYGAENVVMELAKALNESKGYNVIIGVFENSASPHLEIADECKKYRISYNVFNCGGRVDINAVFRIRRYIKQNEIDIVHSHGYKSNLYAFLATLGLKTLLVSTCHNWLGDTYKMKSYASLDRLFLRMFDAIVPVSDDIKITLIRNNVPPKKTRMIKNGISLERFDIGRPKNLRQELGIPENAIVIGIVGRISEEKGHEFLLKAFLGINRNYPEAALLIIGEGVLRESLQAKYNHQSIYFTGNRKDVAELYHIMDIFVLPSLTEGLPMVLLEAMASRLPVIASSVGAIPSVIGNLKSGMVIKPADESELKKALFYLLENKEKRSEMAQAAYEKVKNEFSSLKMAAEYKKIYDELVSKRDVR